MTIARVKQGDDLPVISDTLTLSDGTVPVLTGSVVTFVMRGPWATSAKVNAVATVLNQITYPGAVEYQWVSADVDTPGEYRAEWHVVFPDTSQMTFPTDGSITVLVEESQTTTPVRRLYCAVDDLVLGDLEISAKVSLNDFVRRASRDIDVLLARKYVTPVPTTAPTQVQDLLASVCADLASAYAVMALAQGGEDGMVNAYGMHLFKRGMNALDSYITGDDLLEGVDVRPNPGSTADGPIGIRNEDPESVLSGFYKFVQPQMVPAPSFLVEPVSRPYGY